MNTTDSPSFVDGNFSGTVTTDTINASGSELDLQLGGNTAIKVNSSFSYYYGAAGNTYILQGSDFLRPQGGAAQFDLGGISHRWRTAFVVDGSFTGNLVNEVGGSYKLYNLGSEGDTDTEYLEMSWGTNIASIWNKATGAGTLRELSVGSADNRFRFTASGVICAVNSVTKLNIGSNFTYLGSSVAVLPDTDGTIELGRDAARWQNVASVDGDFSGTVRFGSWEDTGLTGYVETVVPTSDNGQFWIDRNWSGGSSSGRVGIRTDYNASGTAHNHIAVTPTLAEIQLANGLRAVWQTNGNMHRLNMHFRPYVDSTYDNGWTNARWLNYYGVNGSFTGNLVSEVGGSIRHYGLGTEGDTDSHYLNMEFDGTFYSIGADTTGVGSNQALMLRYGGNSRLLVTSGELRCYKDVTSSATSINLGVSSRRWGNIYSVDGNFSGDVTVGAGSTGSITVDTPKRDHLFMECSTETGANKIVGLFTPDDHAMEFGAGLGTGGSGTKFVLRGVNYATPTISSYVDSTQSTQQTKTDFIHHTRCVPSVTDTYSLGTTTSLWSNVYSVNGSFNGNLDVEVGGSNRIFNLGSDADVAAGDTEYLETSFDTNVLQMFTVATGTGVRRNLEFGNADNQVNVKGAADQVVIRTAGTAKMIVNAAVTGSQDLTPLSNLSNRLGSSSMKWIEIYAAQGRFESPSNCCRCRDCGHCYYGQS